MSKKSFRVEIRPEECKGCERCVIACPKGIIEIGSALNSMGYAYATASPFGCIGCGACFYQCPEPGAVTVFERDEE